jgi:hypothetical protein
MFTFPGIALYQPFQFSWKLALKMYTNNREKRKNMIAMSCFFFYKNLVRCAHKWNDGMMEYWNNGLAPFGQIYACGGGQLENS